MAHLRQSGPSFEGLIDTLDSTTSSNSAVSITDDKHMLRVPSWKTGTDATFSNTGLVAGSGFPVSYTHSDRPENGDKISMSDYRGIAMNIQCGSASYQTSGTKFASTTSYVGWFTSAAMAAASNNNLTSQVGTALSEGTTYTTGSIPVGGNYGSTSLPANTTIIGFGREIVALAGTIIVVFDGSGAASVPSGLDILVRGTGNLLRATSTGPDGTWNQNNTQVAAGWNVAQRFTSSSSVTSSGNIRVFRYVQGSGLENTIIFESGTGMNTTLKFP